MKKKQDRPSRPIGLHRYLELMLKELTPIGHPHLWVLPVAK
jgi:hypothetical protein